MDTTVTTPSTPSTATPQVDERVTQHLRTLTQEAEALLKATARSGEEKFDATRDSLRATLEQMRSRLHELEVSTAAQVKRASHRADQAVHAHPYTAMGAAAVVGLLLGLLVSRR